MNLALRLRAYDLLNGQKRYILAVVVHEEPDIQNPLLVVLVLPAQVRIGI